MGVEDGELAAVVGPSGSGKSTALRLIAGLETPSEGAIRLDGEDLAEVDAPDRGVAMVFQSFALFPHMTVARNIGFGLDARGVEPEEVKQRVREVSGTLGIESLLDRRPAELSGGERQRIALARGLVGRPRVLLMDEPLSNLDAPLRAQTRAEIKRVQRELGITVVYVTHDQAEALSLGDRVAIIDRGRLQQLGNPRDVYRRPANVFVAGFVGVPPMNLVRVRVEEGSLAGEGVRLPLPEATTRPQGTELIAGFRPEDAHVGPPRRGSFPGELEMIETAGHDRVVWIGAGPTRIAVRPRDDFAGHEGDEVGVAVPPEAVRLFDPESGETL